MRAGRVKMEMGAVERGRFPAKLSVDGEQQRNRSQSPSDALKPLSPRAVLRRSFEGKVLRNRDSWEEIRAGLQHSDLPFSPANFTTGVAENQQQQQQHDLPNTAEDKEGASSGGRMQDKDVGKKEEGEKMGSIFCQDEKNASGGKQGGSSSSGSSSSRSNSSSSSSSASADAKEETRPCEVVGAAGAK